MPNSYTLPSNRNAEPETLAPLILSTLGAATEVWRRIGPGFGGRLCESFGECWRLASHGT